MTTFIVWPVERDAECRQAIEEVLGVHVQENPLENAQETHYMVGHRMTKQQYEVLEATGFLTLNNTTPPEWWEEAENVYDLPV